ncbi:hypothetical protein PsYK624_114640 [Phanerochaete sordida]|uniref:Uncharacterized protein n=1 Tax=Phanerochaete sordida TaxID=48140 RepID=A0A9P3GIA5_9APHY|nr:hypothetical protein PsYK624_114640 [Phanerochaete sordida]
MSCLLVLAAVVVALGYAFGVLSSAKSAAKDAGDDGAALCAEAPRSPSTSLADVARVQRMLLRRLPRELVDAILLDAEYFANETITGGPQFVQGLKSKECFLADLGELPLQNIVRLSVAIRGYGHLNTGSCDPCRDRKTCAEVRTWYTVATSMEEEHDHDTPRFATNLRCSSEPQVHEQSWTRDSAMVRTVQESKTIVVWAHSSSQRWTNVVNETAVTVSLYPF